MKESLAAEKWQMSYGPESPASAPRQLEVEGQHVHHNFEGLYTSLKGSGGGLTPSSVLFSTRDTTPSSNITLDRNRASVLVQEGTTLSLNF